jgi:hypothetical protein
VDQILKQRIDEKRRELIQRIKDAQAELSKIEQFEALGRELFEAGSASSPVGPAYGPTLPIIPPSSSRRTKKDRILSTSAEILSDGRRRTSKELLGELKERGVEVDGNDPATNLASYLSRAEGFESNRRDGGWGLAPDLLSRPSSDPSVDPLMR